MKKLFTLISASIVFVAAAQEADKGIQFKHNSSWNETLAQAKKENKLIFVDAYTVWCGPCKWMAKNIFTNDTVAEYFNKTFVCAKIDMEKGEGLEFAKKYGVRNYPTLLYINGEGELVHRTCGSTPAQQFIQNGKTAMDPEKRLTAYKNKFEKNTSDPNVVAEYAMMLKGACMNNDKELAAYFATQKETDFTSRSNWNLINRFVVDANSPAFIYFTDNKESFVKLYTKDSVENKIVEVYSKSIYYAIKKGDEATYNTLKTKIKSLNISKSEEIILEADLTYYKTKKDWINYSNSAVAYIEKYGKNNANALNDISWTFYEHVDDKAMLEKAAEWSKLSIEIRNTYANNDTYAAVLYKLGKREEAIAAAEKAIQLGKANNEDYKETEMLLEKIKALK